MQKRKRFIYGVLYVAAILFIIVLFPLMISNIYYLRGQAALKKGDGDRAEELLRTALFWDNDNSEIYLALGNIYLNASRIEMEEYFRVHCITETVYTQPPVSFDTVHGDEIYEDRVEVKELTAKDVRKNIRTGDRNKHKTTKEIVHTYPPFPGSREGYEKKGVEMFRKGIRLNPYDARLYHGLARIMQFAAEPKETEAVFRRAAELDPNNPNIHFSFALFCQRKGMKREGINQMRAAVSVFPVQASKAYKEWIKYGGTVSDLMSIAGGSPTALWKLGLYFEREQYPVRARDAFLAACRSIGAGLPYIPSYEIPSQTLAENLLKKLEQYKLLKEHAFYQGLWEPDTDTEEKRTG